LFRSFQTLPVIFSSILYSRFVQLRGKGLS
jgi:hypothetical protein